MLAILLTRVLPLYYCPNYDKRYHTTPQQQPNLWALLNWVKLAVATKINANLSNQYQRPNSPVYSWFSMKYLVSAALLFVSRNRGYLSSTFGYTQGCPGKYSRTRHCLLLASFPWTKWSITCEFPPSVPNTKVTHVFRPMLLKLVEKTALSWYKPKMWCQQYYLI